MLSALLARPVRLALVALALVAVGVAVWSWNRAGSSTPVDEDAAVRDFRDASGGRATDPATPGVPRPGVYAMRQSGSERGGAGPIGVTRELPDRALYTVTLVQGGYAEELAISEEHIEGVRVRVGPRGVAREVARRTKVTFIGVGRDDRRDLRPPPLRAPRPLAVGRSWGGDYAAGAMPVTYRSTVLRADTVDVEGRRLPARVVRTVGDTGGPHPGRRVDIVWWSPALALPLRWEIDMRIGGPVTLRTQATLTLQSTTPQV